MKKPMLRFKTINGVRYVHDEIAYRMGPTPYWVVDTAMENHQKVMEWAKKNPPIPKQNDSTDTTANKEFNMAKELSNCGQNRLNVESGNIVDKAHAALMDSLTEACRKLQIALDEIIKAGSSNQVIDKMSEDELDVLIASMTTMNDKLTSLALCRTSAI
jgi:hypothetical protein